MGMEVEMAQEAVAGSFTVMYGMGLIGYVVLALGLMKMFEKAGVTGWHAFVPYFNFYQVSQVSGAGLVWFILTFVPFVNVIAVWVLMFKLAKSFGQGAGMGILTALLPPVGTLIMGFGSAQYQRARMM
ncbi:DUF5684 domain-containing protein [Gleimia coleocanis]|nr:DUF5684 domain-containing protein [Gleimia coleocanis]